jgi:hypothetical protein
MRIANGAVVGREFGMQTFWRRWGAEQDPVGDLGESDFPPHTVF